MHINIENPLFSVTALLVIGLPVVVALINLVLAIKSKGQGNSSTPYNRASLAVYCALMGALLTVTTKSIETKLTKTLEPLAKEQNGQTQIVVEDFGGQRRITEKMLERFESTKGSKLHFARAFFSPGCLPGYTIGDDQVLGNAFPQHVPEISYYICFPDMHTDLEPNEEEMRQKMIKFLFALLTREHSLLVGKDRGSNIPRTTISHLRVFHVPRSGNRDMWAVYSQKNPWAGFAYPAQQSGHLTGQAAYSLFTEHPMIVSGIQSELDNLRALAFRHLKAEMQKTNVADRCICLLFWDDDLTRSLEPKSIDWVTDRWERCKLANPISIGTQGGKEQYVDHVLKELDGSQ